MVECSDRDFTGASAYPDNSSVPDWGSMSACGDISEELSWITDESSLTQVTGTMELFTGAGTTLPMAGQHPVALAQQPPPHRGCKRKSCSAMQDLELLEVVGQGSFGTVHKSKWRGRLAAVKIKASAAGGADTEVEILTELGKGNGHGNIISLVAWRKCGSSSKTFLIFPLADHSLRARLQSLRSEAIVFCRIQMMLIVERCVSALVYMHRHRVLHRDLKPGNILLRRPGVSGNLLQPRCERSEPRVSANVHLVVWHPLLADFGNATFLPVLATLPTRRFCTLSYSAPEVLLLKHPYSFPSDVWSLGLVFVELERMRPVFEISDALMCDYELLHRVWKWSRVNDTTDAQDSFDVKVKAELLTRVPDSELNLVSQVHLTLLGTVYGSRFRQFVLQMLRLNPSLRVSNDQIQVQSRELFYYDNRAAEPRARLLD